MQARTVEDFPQPCVEITVQPAAKSMRFRYECEGRSAGSILGENSTGEHKTYPTIQVLNYSGRAIVVVSCVTKDRPYRPHPYKLVGRIGCDKGVCTLDFNGGMSMEFSGLGIQCVKKSDIKAALKLRKQIRVDPFKTGFSHRHQPTHINLSSVRLCFQVFLEGPTAGKFAVALKPVVSNTIFDKKLVPDLHITKLSHCNAPCDGGQEMILLCGKVSKNDIKIRFYEDVEGGWVGYGKTKPQEVHKHAAIVFRTPKFRPICEPTRVKLQLVRPSDGAFSESVDFEMLPQREVPIIIKKTKKLPSDPSPSIMIPQSQQKNFGTHNHHIQSLPNFEQTFFSLRPSYQLGGQSFGSDITHHLSPILCNSSNVVLHPENLILEDLMAQNQSGTSPLFDKDLKSIQPQSTAHSNYLPNVEMNEISAFLDDFPKDFDGTLKNLTDFLNNLPAFLGSEIVL